ncbi:MAG: recombinase family protein, partial [Gammaproteobacteria bacterium]
MRLAYSYIRFSTPDQLKGDSLRRQLELSRNYAEQHGLILDDKLKLRDIGVSAFKGDNIASGRLGAFLKAIDSGKVQRGSLLLIESLDRLTRDQMSKALSVFIEILNSGVSIVSLADGREYTTDSINDIGNLIFSIIELSRAHHESLMKSKRVAAAWENKRQRATAGHILTRRAPAWLREENGRFVAIPERAAIIRTIFQLCIEGYGTTAIIKRFNEQRINAWNGTIEQSTKRTGWYGSYIQKILTNRAVMGELQPHMLVNGKRVPDGESLRGYFPTIIDEQTFYRAQGALK